MILHYLKLNSKKNRANGFLCKVIKLSQYKFTEEKVENSVGFYTI